MVKPTTTVECDALAVLLPGFHGTEVPDWAARRLRQGLAGLWLFGHNITSRDQCRALSERVHDLNPAGLLVSDEEGGTVTRVRHEQGSPWPGHYALGQADDVALTEAVAAELGADLGDYGVDLAAAPVADVNTDPQNPVIGVRSFGSSTDLVARHTRAYVAGLQRGGVLTCAKHFPGHGATNQDSHLTLPRVEGEQDVLASRDWPPFAAAIEAGTDVIMTAHLVVTALGERPATINPEVIDVARKRLGFDGVLCTDALDMHAIAHGVGRSQGAVLALAAGVDLICIGNPAFPAEYDAGSDLEEFVVAITNAVEEGQLPAHRLHEAAQRVRRLRTRLANRENREGRPADTGDPVGAVGKRAAARAVQILGTLPLLDRPRIVAASGGVNVASGARQEVVLCALAESIPGASVSDEHGEVLVTEDLTDFSTPATLERVQAAQVIVHTGFAALPSHLPTDKPIVRTYGGGRASAQAAGDALAKGLT